MIKKTGTKSDASSAASEEAATEKPGTSVAASNDVGYTVRNDGSLVRTLSRPIVGHEGPIKEVALRRPGYRDFMDLGDPKTYVIVNGGYVPQHDLATIERYIERLSGVQSLLLDQADYTDGIALRDAVLSFF